MYGARRMGSAGNGSNPLITTGLFCEGRRETASCENFFITILAPHSGMLAKDRRKVREVLVYVGYM